MLKAGVPSDVIQLVVGDGAIGAALTSSPMIGGVCFTGSTEVAKLIDRQLAETAAPDAMLIAETGRLNAMIVDSTACRNRLSATSWPRLFRARASDVPHCAFSTSSAILRSGSLICSMGQWML